MPKTRGKQPHIQSPTPDVVESTMGVVPSREMTGAFAAVPPTQAGADALRDVVSSRAPIAPKTGDGIIADKRKRGKS
jgi:hypothetical protein